MLVKNIPIKMLQIISLISESNVENGSVARLKNLSRKLYIEFLVHYTLIVFLNQILVVNQLPEDRRTIKTFSVVTTQFTYRETSFKWFLEAGFETLKLVFQVFSQFEVLNLETVAALFVFLLCKTLHVIVVSVVKNADFNQPEVIQNSNLSIQDRYWA